MLQILHFILHNEKGKVVDRKSERNRARKHEGDVYFTVLLLSFLSRPYIRFHHFLLYLQIHTERVRLCLIEPWVLSIYF